MIEGFKPLLGYTVKDTDALTYPLLASPKLDGIRAIIIDGVVMSRRLKPIPNAHVQALFGRHELEGFDGELVVGPPTDHNCYQATSSGVMSRAGEPDVTFYVFDRIDAPGVGFYSRGVDLRLKLGDMKLSRVKLLPQTVIRTPDDLLAYETQRLAQGYEGVMVRDPKGRYKFGRSTARGRELGKLKRFTDGEARITGFQQFMTNGNEQERDALGRAKRSSHKANMIPVDTLGSLLVTDLVTGIAFSIGSGFDQATRKRIWDDRDAWLGRIVKYKSFHIGVKEAPRFPIFLGERFTDDL